MQLFWVMLAAVSSVMAVNLWFHPRPIPQAMSVGDGPYRALVSGVLMMGTPTWPDDPHRTKRSRKYREHDVPEALAESRWQCQTCPGVIASNDDIYCLHCKMYWEDVANGLFDEKW